MQLRGHWFSQRDAVQGVSPWRAVEHSGGGVVRPVADAGSVEPKQPALLACAQRLKGAALFGDVAEHDDRPDNLTGLVADRRSGEPAGDSISVGLHDLVDHVLGHLALQHGTRSRPLLRRDRSPVKVVAATELAVGARRRGVRRAPPQLVVHRVAELDVTGRPGK